MFASQGIKTVYYLPLASAVSRYDGISVSEEDQKKWCGKISFVGSLYNESHNYYDQIEP
jgi:spore maturation protein CgeB